MALAPVTSLSPVDVIGPVTVHAELGLDLLRGTTGATCEMLAASVTEALLLVGGVEFFDLRRTEGVQSYLSAAAECAEETDQVGLKAAVTAHRSFLPRLRRPRPRGDRGRRPRPRAGGARRLGDYAVLALDQARFKGYAYLSVRRPVEAREALTRTLSALPGNAQKQRAVTLADLAAAHLQQGEIEAATQLARTALQVTVEESYATAAERLLAFRVALDPFRQHSAVVEFDERLRLAQIG